MKILAIETSCDETAIAVLSVSKNKFKVLSNEISSQVRLHAKFGGVVPSLAAREHEKNLPIVLKKSLAKAKIKMEKVDLITVTQGPGLAPSLWRGLNFSKELARKYKKTLIPTSHMEGHIFSNWLNPDFKPASIKFPILHLIVSGGHTELVLMKNYGEYELIGETVDDAVGEAFDKVARLLNLGYPGGPVISKLAETGDADHYPLPSPMINSKDLNFSYSGLKTAVLYLTRDLGKLTPKIKRDICASFQKAAINVLIKKTSRAIDKYRPDSIMLSGGVSANTLLRSEFKKLAEEKGLRYSRPQMEYTTDNAAMIGMAGYFEYIRNKKSGQNIDKIEINANLGF